MTANIGEADAANVKAGQSATVTFVAGGTTAPGTVTSVALQGTTSNNVVQYPVTVTLGQARTASASAPPQPSRSRRAAPRAPRS